MKGPILVILSGGMGSRYGGLKQIDRIGNSGEVLMDYSVFDALRAGYKKIVFVIRHDIEKDFSDIVLKRIKNHVDYELAFQEIDTLIPEDIVSFIKNSARTKPWGTAHALLCAKEFIDAPFSVINADDFYGKEAYQVMGKFLQQDNLKEGAIVPYRLENTLSEMGTVSRGVCSIKDGCLQSVDEMKLIEKQDGKIFNTFDDGKRLDFPKDTQVSMNFWGFPFEFISEVQKYFDDFIARDGREPKSECYVPLAVDFFIKNKGLTVRSLDANALWFGVTYKEDKEAAIQRIAELTKQGVYPEKLWP
ncbi:MAG: nucleotidyltransferase [Termitinemataceae bacterium]|nr:MAG: nucleotidyltransferase [Termitinemataceae bacterium]